jgi:hypothetical protein
MQLIQRVNAGKAFALQLKPSRYNLLAGSYVYLSQWKPSSKTSLIRSGCSGEAPASPSRLAALTLGIGTNTAIHRRQCGVACRCRSRIRTVW